MAARKIHRWKDPTYNLQGGAFPGGIGGVTYDRLNIGSEGAGGAPADAQKVGGNFPGTYGVDFEEDAKALAPNRMLRALGENTDLLDDLFRASVPAALKVSWAGGASFQSLVGTAVFVGKTGEAVPLATELVQLVVTATGLPATSASGVTIVATDVVDDTSLSTIRGITADGFSTNARVVWNATVPAGAYTVIVGGRSALAVLAEERPFEFLRTLVLVERSVSAILALYKHGLDERYRRSNKVVAGTENQAGAGATVLVDGPAVTLRGSTSQHSVRRDPHDAILSVDHTSYFAPTVTNSDAALFGGFVLTDGRDALGHISGMSSPVTGGFLFAAARPANSGSLSAASNTQIRFAAAVLNHAGTGDQVQLQAGDRFWRSAGGFNRSMIRLGFDLLKVVRASGATEVYVISALNADARIASLRNLNGSVPTFPGSEAVTVYLIQPYTSIGASRQQLHQLGGLTFSHIPDTRENDDGAARVEPTCFLAPRLSVGATTPGSATDPETVASWNDFVAARFGGWDTARASDQAFQRVNTAGVLGNGRFFTIDFFHGAFRGRSSQTGYSATTVGATTSVTVAPSAPHIELLIDGDFPVQVLVGLTAEALGRGCETSLTVLYTTLSVHPWMSWPAGLTFREGEQQVPEGAMGRYIWKFTGLGSSAALVERSYYPA